VQTEVKNSMKNKSCHPPIPETGVGGTQKWRGCFCEWCM